MCSRHRADSPRAIDRAARKGRGRGTAPYDASLGRGWHFTRSGGQFERNDGACQLPERTDCVIDISRRSNVAGRGWPPGCTGPCGRDAESTARDAMDEACEYLAPGREPPARAEPGNALMRRLETPREGSEAQWSCARGRVDLLPRLVSLRISNLVYVSQTVFAMASE